MAVVAERVEGRLSLCNLSLQFGALHVDVGRSRTDVR